MIGLAIQRAQKLESDWLKDESMVTFIDLLKKDSRAAAVYNAIDHEAIRLSWVRRQLMKGA